MPIKNDVSVRRTVDAKNVISRLGSIFTGKVGVPPLIVGRYTAKSEKSQMVNTIKRKRYGKTFLKPMFHTLCYHVLSAVTTIVTLVA
jgi:hypothetical protein